MSSDSEYEEEEIYVFADFMNQLLPKEISTHPIKIIGLETEQPIAELNGNIFKGTYDFTIGTNVFFEKDRENNEPVDTLFEEACKQKYNFLEKCNKVINFQRIYVDKNEQEDQKMSAEEAEAQGIESNQENQERILNELKINMSYEDALAQFPAWNEKKK